MANGGLSNKEIFSTHEEFFTYISELINAVSISEWKNNLDEIVIVFYNELRDYGYDDCEAKFMVTGIKHFLKTKFDMLAICIN